MIPSVSISGTAVTAAVVVRCTIIANSAHGEIITVFQMIIHHYFAFVGGTAVADKDLITAIDIAVIVGIRITDITVVVVVVVAAIVVEGGPCELTREKLHSSGHTSDGVSHRRHIIVFFRRPFRTVQ